MKPIAEELAAALREHPAANRVEVAGSVRRWAETCKDIDLIATAEEPAALAEHLAAHPLIAAAGTPGPNGVRAQTHNGVSVDLRIVPPGRLRQPAAALHRLPGPQRAAARRGGRPRPLGLRARHHRDRERRRRACETEEEVYERLGYDYIEPELREGRGELKAAREGKLPRAGRARRHQGRPPLPHHPLRRPQQRSRRWPRRRATAATTTWRSPTTPPATASATTSPPSGSGSGSRRSAPGTRAAARSGFRLLAGSEINIGLDGSLDYPDDLVAALDWVVASVHTSFSSPKSR